jgi:Raf kinase inhibitor-like YbhB/YbcL family protein
MRLTCSSRSGTMNSMIAKFNFGRLLNPPFTWRASALALLLVFRVSAADAQDKSPQMNPHQSPGAFQLTSPEFENGGFIPQRFTCDGVNISPLLAWTHPPAAVQSFTLILDDPDAPSGTFVHWLVYNLPREASGMPDNVPIAQPIMENGALQGENDFHHIGYNGPCPPRGKVHRYIFHLYALDTQLTLKPGAKRDALDRMMGGHILATAELMGRYQRP